MNKEFLLPNQIIFTFLFVVVVSCQNFQISLIFVIKTFLVIKDESYLIKY